MIQVCVNGGSVMPARVSMRRAWSQRDRDLSVSEEALHFYHFFIKQTLAWVLSAGPVCWQLAFPGFVRSRKQLIR